jgi:DNA-binding NarL/FixJ family response regulator
MQRPTDALIRQGREAFLRGDGPAARRAFEAALQQGETGEALEGLGRARYIETDYRGALDAHEQAYRAYRLEGNALGAARAARMLAWIHANLHGDWAVSNGWLARASRFLEDAGEESAERGWLEVVRATSEQVPERREQRYRRALELARRFDDRDLEIEALGWIALELILAGRVDEGMLRMDEALAAVCAGEVQDLYVMEGIFCTMFTTCERVHDVARAEQWIRAAHDVIRRRSLVALGAFCRAHYGAILTDAGRWDEAEEELLAAARIFGETYASQRSDAVARLADLRVRQGRLEEAARLLEGLDQHPYAARPLAVWRLARGEVALARDLLERALEREPGPGLEDMTPLLALLVEVQLAEGAVDDAEKTADRLDALVQDQPGEFGRGSAALARGRVVAASGRGDARRFFLAALAAFARAQMPMEQARARLELARVVAAERPEVAGEEARAALQTFIRLEARRDADEAEALLRSLVRGRPLSGPRVGSGGHTLRALTEREAEVLRLVAAGRRNREIAAELVISEHTVARHVQNILAKLDVTSRAAAAALAVERRLV